MRIPVSFMLFGEKITVERCEALLEKDSCVGQALYRKNAIELIIEQKAKKNYREIFFTSVPLDIGKLQ